MKVFFRIEYPEINVDVKKESLGIHTANTELLVNLIKFSRIIEEYGFVVAKPGEGRKLTQLFPDKIIRGHDFGQPNELTKVLQHYDIFFMAGYGIYDVLKCEPLFQRKLSIIGITHSLSLDEIGKSLKDASKICSRKDVLICTSSTAKNSVQKVLGTSDYRLRLETIPFGVDIDKFCPIDEERKKHFRRKFNLPDDATIFLHLGRLSPCNKMELTPLLKAFSDLVGLSESGGKSYLLILGREHSPGYVKVLEALATKLNVADKVRIVSSYDASNIPQYYKLADIFVSPSDNIQETFGLTVLEAMASGLPVIVTDWDGYRDTVVDGTTGFRIPTYWADCGMSWNKRFQLGQSVAMDMDRLVESMRTLLENGALRKTFGEAARDHVESNFAWEGIIKQYDALFHQAALGTRDEFIEDSTSVADSSGTSPTPAEVFESYPTEFVGEDFHIRLRDIDGFSGYSNILQLADGEVVNRVANLIAKKVTRVGDITQILGRKHGIPMHETLFQIMLMMKYGVFASANTPVTLSRASV